MERGGGGGLRLSEDASGARRSLMLVTADCEEASLWVE